MVAWTLENLENLEKSGNFVLDIHSIEYSLLEFEQIEQVMFLFFKGFLFTRKMQAQVLSKFSCVQGKMVREFGFFGQGKP